MSFREMVGFALAYDGEGFHGFQRQPGLRTVESVLFECLGKSGCWDRLSADTYSYGGRTDAGVSAFGQIVSFSPQPSCDIGRFKECLEDNDILLWGVRKGLPPCFRARYWSVYRDYMYIDEMDRYISEPRCIHRVLSRLYSIRYYGFLYKDYGEKRIPGPWYLERRILGFHVAVRKPFISFLVRGESFPVHFMRRLVCFLRSYDCSKSFSENIATWRPCSSDPRGLFLLRAMNPYYPQYLEKPYDIIRWVLLRVFRKELPDLFSLAYQFFLFSWLS